MKAIVGVVKRVEKQNRIQFLEHIHRANNIIPYQQVHRRLCVLLVRRLCRCETLFLARLFFIPILMSVGQSLSSASSTAPTNDNATVVWSFSDKTPLSAYRASLATPSRSSDSWINNTTTSSLMEFPLASLSLSFCLLTCIIIRMLGNINKENKKKLN